MSFEPSQVRMLRARLKSRHVKSREAEGATLRYVEGWHVIAEANRIFGFDAWDRETVASQCVWTKNLGNRFAVAYITRVRIGVRAGEVRITREGCGAGEATATTPGQAHEMAAKAAETDATKRALSTFGNPFGLSLYGGTPPHARQAAPPALTGNGSAAFDSAVPRGRPIMPGSVCGAAPQGKNEVARQDDGTSGEDAGSSVASSADVPWPIIDPFEEAARRAAERAQPIDKSALRLSEPIRRRDSEHLKFVARQPCMVCGRSPSEAHHLKFAQPAALGRKVSDEFTVPLCALHHRELHACGDERRWWAQRRVDPQAVARELWEHSRPTGTRLSDANLVDTKPAPADEAQSAAPE